MGAYTASIVAEADELDFDDEDFEQRMLRIAKLFRTQSDALTDFLCAHGYDGRPEDAQAKAAFLQEKCRAADVECPRNMAAWFAEGKRFERQTAFQLCFALGLETKEADSFFQKVLFDRSFDCHSITELVYAYCLRSGRSYTEAKMLLARMPAVEAAKKIDLQASDILYTDAIMDALQGIESEEELLAYVQAHAAQFSYHSVSCMKRIQGLWAEISGDHGLAYREWRLQSSLISEQIKPLKAAGNSTWAILSYMLWLDKDTARNYGTARSIGAMLEDNPLVPASVRDSFPARNTIERICRGERTSNETLRKWLILLAFYSFWAGAVVEGNALEDTASRGDAERFRDQVDARLLDVGFLPLYAGNPYDWIFLWCIKDKPPLTAFREYIEELGVYQRDMAQLEPIGTSKGLHS